MEIFFIGMLVLVLFLEKFPDARDQLIEVCHRNPRGLIKYMGSAAALSLTFSLLPTLFLTIYMRSNDFFAYEVFGEQNYAFQILSLNVFFHFLILSMYLFMSIFLWKLRAGKPIVFGSVAVSALFICFLIFAAVSTGRYDLLFSILVFCALVGGAFTFWITKDFDEKAQFWAVPLLFAAAFLGLPVFFSENTAVFTESALAQMKVGGIDAELSEPLGFSSAKPPHLLRGKLLLRTSNFYYIRPLGDPDHLLIVSSEHVALRYPTKSRKNVGTASASLEKGS